MKNCIYLLTATLFGMVSSCRQKSDSEIITEHFAKIDSAFCTNDVREAEKAVLADFDTISEYESNHIKGLDFDVARAQNHERLFLIYRKTHETNKMAFEFEQSMESLSQSAKKWGLPPPMRVSYEDFAGKLEKNGRWRRARWMTNDLHLGNN
jgi:hypothetical protein